MKIVLLLCLFIIGSSHGVNTIAGIQYGYTIYLNTGIKYKVLTDKRRNWNDARSKCAALGGQLASISSSNEWEFVKVLLEESGISNHIKERSADNSVWLGGSDPTLKNEWKWTNGSSVNYNDWDDGQPSTKTDPVWSCMFAFQLSSWKWKRGTCQYLLFAVCELPVSLSTCPPSSTCPTCPPPATCPTCPPPTTCPICPPTTICPPPPPPPPTQICPSNPGAGWTRDSESGSWYKVITDTATWYAQKRNCESMGATLASIRTSQEWIFVKDLIGHLTQNIFIGANDDGSEANWTWRDGSPVQYKGAWYPGKPIISNDHNCASPHWDHDWRWYDVECSRSYGALCKIQENGFIRNPATGTWYKLLTNYATWNAQKLNCESMGAELASIRNSEEWNFVKDILKLFSQNVYIGASDSSSEGWWSWTDGSLVQYKGAWYPGKPIISRDHNCAAAHWSQGWRWYDVECSRTYWALCKIPG